jgi:hypothetical protein
MYSAARACQAGNTVRRTVPPDAGWLIDVLGFDALFLQAKLAVAAEPEHPGAEASSWVNWSLPTSRDHAGKLGLTHLIETVDQLTARAETEQLGYLESSTRSSKKNSDCASRRFRNAVNCPDCGRTRPSTSSTSPSNPTSTRARSRTWRAHGLLQDLTEDQSRTVLTRQPLPEPSLSNSPSAIH